MSGIATFEDRKTMIKYYSDFIVKPKFLEIGIFKGDFFDYIVKNCDIHSIDGVDLFTGVTCSGDVDGNNVVHCDIEKCYFDLLEKYRDMPNVNLHKSDSVNFLKQREDNYYDIIYIDGDHSYNGVKNDLFHSLHKVKHGGYIMGHDYEMNYAKAMNSYNFGVKEAVDEFCDKYNQKFVAKAMDGCVSYCIKINKQ